MEEQKLVLQDGTYKYDDRTRQVSVSEEQLKKAGYVKLADDEQIVKKVALSEEEAEFMQETERLAFYDPQNIDFGFKVNDYAEDHAEHLKDIPKIYERLFQAYFNGYTVRKTKYYIKLPGWFYHIPYLNLEISTGELRVDGKTQSAYWQTQLTQAEIDELQERESVRGVDLNALKVKVPDNELAD